MLERRQCGGDGAAARVAHHHHQRHAEHPDTELDAPQCHTGERLARGAHREQVADPDVEDELGRDPRVDAAEQGRDRLLSREVRLSFGRRQAVVDGSPVGEAVGAVQQLEKGRTGGGKVLG